MLAPMDATEFTRAPRPPLRIAVVTETYLPEVNDVAITVGRPVDGLQAHNRPDVVQIADGSLGWSALSATHRSWEAIIDRFEQLPMRLAQAAPATRSG
jgi:hypothetical protein